MGQTTPVESDRLEQLADGTNLLIRPIRPEDEALYPAFLSHVTPDDLRLRFFAPVKELDHALISRLTHYDPARAMAFGAFDPSNGQLLGVARLHRLPAPASDEAEYAILIRSDLKGHGLGWLLMQTLIDYARSASIREIAGEVLPDNPIMLKMCQELGFHIVASPHDPYIRVVRLRVDDMPS